MRPTDEPRPDFRTRLTGDVLHLVTSAIDVSAAGCKSSRGIMLFAAAKWRLRAMAKSRRKRTPKTVLKLPDLEQSKSAALNSLTSASSKRSYDRAIREFIDWYCSEPRLAFNRTVVKGLWATPSRNAGLARTRSILSPRARLSPGRAATHGTPALGLPSTQRGPAWPRRLQASADLMHSRQRRAFS